MYTCDTLIQCTQYPMTNTAVHDRTQQALYSHGPFISMLSKYRQTDTQRYINSPTIIIISINNYNTMAVHPCGIALSISLSRPASYHRREVSTEAWHTQTPMTFRAGAPLVIAWPSGDLWPPAGLWKMYSIDLHHRVYRLIFGLSVGP